MKNISEKSKHVYIIGNENIGFLGHTYDKDMAKSIVNKRKRLEYRKIKNDEWCKENLSVNTEFMEIYENAFVTASEQEYFFESFNQFQLDVIYYIDRLIKNIKYIRLTDKEKDKVGPLLYFLAEYKYFILEGQYDEDLEECVDSDLDSRFNNEAALKWFIKNSLDGDTK